MVVGVTNTMFDGLCSMRGNSQEALSLSRNKSNTPVSLLSMYFINKCPKSLAGWRKWPLYKLTTLMVSNYVSRGYLQKTLLNTADEISRTPWELIAAKDDWGSWSAGISSRSLRSRIQLFSHKDGRRVQNIPLDVMTWYFANFQQKESEILYRKLLQRQWPCLLRFPWRPVIITFPMTHEPWMMRSRSPMNMQTGLVLLCIQTDIFNGHSFSSSEILTAKLYLF